jgi:hypothetical protein
VRSGKGGACAGLIVLDLRVDYAAVRATSAMVVGAGIASAALLRDAGGAAADAHVRVRGRGSGRGRALTKVIEGATAESASASGYHEVLDARKKDLFAVLTTVACAFAHGELHLRGLDVS